MSFQLDTGICQRISSATFNEDELLDRSITLQVLSLNKVGRHQDNTNLHSDRYRIVLSDGAHFLQAVLGTHLNNMVVEENLRKNTLVCIERLSFGYVRERRIMIIMALRILGQEDGRIGEPVPIETIANPEAPTPAVENPLRQPTAQSTSSSEVPALSVCHLPQRNNWHPIESLGPYQNNWTIKARIIQKTELKSFSNVRGEGKVFNVTFKDETGEIRATAFNAIADDLYPKLKEGKVYYISKGKVNLANKKYSKVQNDFEITLEAKTEIEECEEASSLPTIKYNFVTLQELHNLPKDSNCVDIIGILKEYGDVSEITSQKTNRTMQKRDLTLVDESGFFVRLTLWGKEAENFSSDKENPVVAFKGVKVFAYEGRSLGMTSSSIMTRDPDIPESYALQGWYDSTGSTMTFQSQRNAGGSLPGSGGGGFNRSEMKTLCEMKLEADRIPDSDEKPVYFSTRAMVMHIRNENIAYPACETCKKKVVEEGGSWRCDKCNKLWSRPTYRYIMSFVVSDHTGKAWFQGFNDVGDTLFGKSANEITEIKDNDDAKYNSILAEACGKLYNFVLRAKRDDYNDNKRIRYGVARILPLNYKEECEALLNSMDTPWGQQELKMESNDMLMD
ncbi:replication factor-A protein 1 [Lentinula raphanica]|nr:replication factor-A protein 1 [Lentinula raphanica]